MRRFHLFTMLVCIAFCLVSCRTEPAGGTPTVLDPYYIDHLSSRTLEDGTIVFSWDYVSDEFDHLDIVVSSDDGSFSDSVVIADREENTYSMAGESGKVYSYSFSPFSHEGKAGKVFTGTRYIQPEGESSGLPRVVVTTVGHEWPDADYVTHPEGSFGLSITNNDYVYCSIAVLDANGEGVNKEKNSKGDACKIKIRGNTSAYSDKKPYKIKLNKKEDLVGLLSGRTGDQYEDKDWLLLSSGTTLRNVVGFAATECLGIEYAPAYAYVELYLNGDYRGVYMLVESVKEGNADLEGNLSRCAVSEDGYVIENDPYWWNEDLYFRTSIMKKNITFKYPDPDDMTESRLSYIRDYVNGFERALRYDYDVYEFIDGRSFSAWVMVHEYLGCYDAGGSNQYMIKRDSTPGTKLEMTTAWDFDGIMSSHDEDKSANMNRNGFFYSKALLKRSDFKALCRERYAETRDAIVSFINGRIDSLDAEAIDLARVYDAERWKCGYDTVSSQRAEVNSWLARRLKWMDTVYK